MSGQFARIIANFLVMGGSVLVRAAAQAYRQAIVSAFPECTARGQRRLALWLHAPTCQAETTLLGAPRLAYTPAPRRYRGGRGRGGGCSQRGGSQGALHHGLAGGAAGARRGATHALGGSAEGARLLGTTVSAEH
jgi:hypothetical protein